MAFFGNFFGRKDPHRIRANPDFMTPLPLQTGYVGEMNPTTQLQLEKLKERVRSSTQEYKAKISMFKKKQQDFDELAKSYVNSLQIIIDVRKIMGLYMETFENINNEISSSEAFLNGLSSEDLQTLRTLTTNGINKMEGNILDEIENIKKLFARDPTKLSRVNALEGQIRHFGTTSTVNSYGGRKQNNRNKQNKPLPKKTQPNKTYRKRIV